MCVCHMFIKVLTYLLTYLYISTKQLSSNDGLGIFGAQMRLGVWWGRPLMTININSLRLVCISSRHGFVIENHATWMPGPRSTFNNRVRISVSVYGLTSHSTHNRRSFRRRVFTGNRLHWYWQPNNNKEEMHKTQNSWPNTNKLTLVKAHKTILK